MTDMIESVNDMTQEQILSAADPGVAMAAFKGDEAGMLRTILATMCLDAKCKDLFERVWLEGYCGVPHYSAYGSDYDHVLERLQQLRDRIEFESDALRSDLHEVMEEVK